MLQSIREKTSGWIASIILGLIILTMAFFGMQDYLVPKVESYAARVESAPTFWVFGAKTKDVSVDDFRRRFQQVRGQQQAEQGDEFDAAKFETAENKRLVLDRMIDEAVLALVAEREGIVVSPSQVQKFIADMPAFQVGGKFDKDRYLSTLSGQGMTPTGFDQLVRTSLLQQAIPEEIADSAMLGDDELEQFLRLSGQTRHVRFLAVPAPADPLPPASDADIQAWYDAHAAQYRTPERVSIDYLELDASSLPVTTQATEEQLRQKYKAEIQRFGAPEERLVSHIQVQVAADADAAAWSAAEAKAKDIAARARAAGADFAALAASSSDDIATKDAGGDLGDVNALGNDAFTAAVAKLQPGQVSDPVRSSSGWHVLLFRELVPGSAKPFEEVRDQLQAEYAETERERAFSDAESDLIDAVNATPSLLAAVAEKTGLAVQKAGPFTASAGEGIAALPAVRNAAFGDDQKLERQVSDTVELGEGQVVVLQVTDHSPAADQPLAAVRDRVVADLDADRLSKATQARAEALAARIKAGESIDVLATEVGGQAADVPQMGRQAPGPQFTALVDAAFALPRPAAGKPEATVAKLASGEHALVVVESVTDGDTKALEASMRDQIREQIRNARGVEDARAYVQALRRQYKITVAEDRL
jgi:peptidyl-prolyl cis-trans isomerase D